MKFSLKDKNAVITGGGRGIGKGIANIFSQHGAVVYILDTDTEANQTAEMIKQNGGKAKWFACDISSVEEVKNTFIKIAKEVSTVDILVNNAGIAHVGNIEATTEEDFDRIVNVNVKGVYHCSYTAIPFMKKQKSGVILNLASVASLVGMPDRFVYSMSKGAVVAMTLSLARDYLAFNIRCNCISPARVHTPFVDTYLAKYYPGHEKEMFEKLSEAQPMGRMGTIDEIANLALYLCSDEASFITGHNYAIDGGYVSLR